MFIYVYAFVHMYVRMCVIACVCVCACVCMCMCVDGVPKVIYTPGEQKPQKVDTPVLPLHGVLHALFRAGPAQFNTSILGPYGERAAAEFATWARSKEWGESFKTDRDLPIVWHLDGASIYSNSEFYVWSWSCLLASSANAHVCDVKFPFLVLPHVAMRDKHVKHGVFNEVCKYLAHTHRYAKSGIYPPFHYDGRAFQPGTPEHALAGTRLAGPWQFVFAGWKGDLKARTEAHDHRRNYQATFLCDQCCATQAFKHAPRDVLYTDFSAEALWRQTILGNETYMESCTSPWRIIEGFRAETLYWDLMHIIYIGFGRDLLGSAIGELLIEGLLPPEGTEAAALRAWWLGFTQWCKQNRICAPPGTLTLSGIGWGQGKTEYPELLTRFKASAVKVMIAYIAVYTDRVCTGSMHSRVRTTCCWALAEFCFVLDGASLILKPCEVRRARRAGSLFLCSYQYMSAEALRNQIRLWKIKPKMHYFCHVLDSLGDLPNPRHVECFTDESYLGKVKALGQKCHGATISKRILQRYIIYLAIRWHTSRQQMPLTGP
jgi:hypothetical protein